MVFPLLIIGQNDLILVCNTLHMCALYTNACTTMYSIYGFIAILIVFLTTVLDSGMTLNCQCWNSHFIGLIKWKIVINTTNVLLPLLVQKLWEFPYFTTIRRVHVGLRYDLDLHIPIFPHFHVIYTIEIHGKTKRNTEDMTTFIFNQIFNSHFFGWIS